MKTASQFISAIIKKIIKPGPVFQNRLSMHVMPVILALAFIIITERKINTSESTAVHVSTKPVTTGSSYLTNLSILNTGNIQHIATIYRVTRLAANLVR